MRTIGLSLCLLLAAAGPAPSPAATPGTWSPQTSGVSTALSGVTFLNSTEGFAVGAGGVIRRTLNGGTSAWTAQTSGTTGNLNGVGFGGVDLGCAAGDGGLILQTQNGSAAGGSTWASTTTGDLAAVAGFDAMHAWTAGAPGALRSTADGSTWPVGNPGSTSAAARGMSFLTAPTEGYWVGDMGTIMKTTDGTTWLPTGASGTTNNLNAVSMVLSSLPGNATGWAAGDLGTLRKTINSGTLWSPVTSGTAQNLGGVFAGDATHAWAVGAGGTIVATTNGTSWMVQPNPLGGTTFTAISLVSSAGTWKGVAVGSGGGVAYTTNGGMTWTSGSSGTSSTLRGVAMLSATTAVAVGDAGTLLQSTNGGISWSTIASGLTGANLLAVTSVSATTGWAVGSNGTILMTTTGGSSWTVQVGGTSNPLRDVKFGSPTVAIAVGDAATILRSQNGGAQWVPMTSLDAPWGGRNLDAIAFGTSDRAVAVGPSGGVLVTNDQGSTWTTVVPSSPLTDELFSVASISPTFFVAVGGSAASGDAVLISFDTTSSTWSATVSATPPSVALRGVSFAPYSLQGFAVGDGGQIVSTLDGGSTWTAEVSGTSNNLRGVSFPDQSLGWAVSASGDILVRQATPPPLLSFPPHVGTPYTWAPPVVDGFINPELTETRRPDTGWNQALELSYSDGTSTSPFTFQGLRHNSANYLYFSFDVRADTGFDNDDTIVILLRGDNPSPRAEHAANDRRIIINPLTTGTGSPAGPIVADGYVAPSYTNNENGDPRSLVSYKWDVPTSAWVAIPASTEITCKVRSWIPTPGNYCWSVEIQVPTVNTVYTDWINIGTDFLFSFYTLRVQTGGVAQFSWPRDQVVSGPLDVVAAPFSALDWGTAKLGTAADGVGVQIKVPPYQNIGVTTPSTPPGTLETQIHGTLENTFHVFVQNNSTSVASSVQPTFRIADWGVQGGDPSSGAWHLVPANQATTNPPPAASVPAISGSTPGVTEYTCKWLMSAAQAASYVGHEHQCILVTLDSASAVNFTQRSSWTNMDYVPASVFERQAYVTSKGYGLEGARKGQQRFFLHTTSERFDFTPGQTPIGVVPPPNPQEVRRDQAGKGVHPYYSGENLQHVRLLSQFPGLAQEKTPVSHLTWQIHAVKQSSRTVKINGHVYPILQQANGFGYIARHGSAVEDWTSGLSGAVVRKLNEFEYEVDVPANGSAPIQTGLEAKDPGGIRGGGLLGLVLALLLFLLIIFWFLKRKP